MLATGALIASLLAVGASPIGAQAATRVADEAERTTALSACVGDATDDHMFTDVSDGHDFKDAINCIVYYGITNGTGDGSTYSPGRDVTRAEMAVLIARAAGVAGVDVGSGSGGFSDIGGVWQEAQDAINALAAKGMIPSGGEFRPRDAITRAEMATFLIGLLAKAADNVTIDSNGAIQLGTPGDTLVADDWFEDARASLPRDNDAEVSALFELGVTKGASPAAVQDDTKRPLDYNYEPFGTVDRGEMAEFITRALGHTPVRPAGISAQYESTTSGIRVIVSARDAEFQPKANVTVDVFRTDTASVGSAFAANGACDDVAKVSGGGEYLCEIDGSDLLTGGGGDAPAVGLGTDGDRVDKGGTTVWAWTGDLEDTFGSDTERFRLNIPDKDAPVMATRVRVIPGHPDDKKVHLGSSVLYTVQLEDDDGNAATAVTDSNNKLRPADFLVKLSTYGIQPTADSDPVTYERTAEPSLVSTLPISTGADGKVTFPVSGLPDLAPSRPSDKYVVNIEIQPNPLGNAPVDPTPQAAGNSAFIIGAVGSTQAQDDAAGVVSVRDVGTTATDYTGGLIFSTMSRPRLDTLADAAAVTAAGFSISVEPAARYVAASMRGAGNRATVTVTDVYGDPVAGAKVQLRSSRYVEANPRTHIAGDRTLAVGRDGSYTFGYTRAGAAALTETLIATWDPDNNSATTNSISTPAAGATGAVTVEWAVAADTTGVATSGTVRAVDTDTNTVFAGAPGGIVVLNYDSNDRFDVGTTDTESFASYAKFERELQKAIGDTTYSLSWTGYSANSRDVNTLTLTIPAG